MRFICVIGCFAMLGALIRPALPRASACKRSLIALATRYFVASSLCPVPPHCSFAHTHCERPEVAIK